MPRLPSVAAALAGALVLLNSRLPARADEPAATPRTVVDEASGVSETVFQNGLTLLVKPQPENPVVTTMIWYAVGSRDEGVGETGLSHYLEHMLFKGTDRYTKGAIDKLTQLNGGSNNASTRNDATEYHFAFPADRWEVALEIESNRMRNSNCPQAEFDAEKKVVLNELWIGLDDPSDVLSTAVGSAVFPVGRYHHPVIGWQEDVETTTRERMLAYYLKHYTPDRATLVVVGGVDRDRVIARTGELFGPIPRGTTVRFEQKEPPALGETRLTLMQDTQVPRVTLAWRSMPILDPREPMLDLASGVLSGDKTSRLEKALVDTGIAAQASCYSDTRRDDGVFVVDVQPAPDHTLEECEAVVRKVVAELAEKGPTADELARARTKLIAEQTFGLESSDGYASRLGGLAVVGDWRYVLRYAKALEAATPESVRDAAKAVFHPQKVVVGRSLPKDGEGAAEGGGAGAPAAGGSHRAAWRADVGARGARFRADGGAPAAGGGAAAPAPATAASPIERALTLDPESRTLPNGLRVHVLRRGTVPVLNASLTFLDGRLGEAVPGLDALTGSLLEEGTTVRSGEEVAAAIGAVGGSLSAGSPVVAAKVLSKDAGLAFELMAEVASKPKLAPDALERNRQRQLAAIEEELDTPRAVGQARFNREIYGAAHPLGRSARGDEPSVKAITREQVVAHHAAFFVPKNAILVVVSDRPTAEIYPLVEKAFGAWTGGDAPKVAPPAIPAPAARGVRIDLEKNQSNLFLGHVGIERNDPDYVALQVLDNVFGVGAGFTSRLAMNVRDQKGLAYTVWGSVTSGAGVRPGTFTVFAGTKPSDAAVALAEMRKEVEGILSRPPTGEELDGAKAALRGEMVTRCETGADLVGVLTMCARYGLGFDYPKRYLEAVAKVTVDDVMKAAKAHVHPDALVEVVVGPKEK